MILDRNTDKNFKAMLGETEDGLKYQVPHVDASTHALETIEYEHHEIHSGAAYTAYYTLTTAATDAHRTGLFIKTPVNKEIHLVASFAASTAANFSVCEAVTIDANAGTHAVAIYNRDRNSSKTSMCKDNATAPAEGKFTTLTEAQIAAASFTAGTVIRTEPLRVGDSPKPAGGQSRATQEYVLKKDTKYVFLITNTAASANTHFIIIDWYEHTKREA